MKMQSHHTGRIVLYNMHHGELFFNSDIGFITWIFVNHDAASNLTPVCNAT